MRPLPSLPSLLFLDICSLVCSWYYAHVVALYVLFLIDNLPPRGEGGGKNEVIHSGTGNVSQGWVFLEWINSTLYVNQVVD